MSAIFNFLYQFVLVSAEKMLPFFSKFNTKISLFYKGQMAINERLAAINKFKIQYPSTPFVWFHCASLGEFEQGRPLIESFRTIYPKHKIVLTFFSPSGYEIRKNYQAADFVMYLPLDTMKNAKKFVQIIQPQIAVFVKYEFWPNMIYQLKKANSTLIGISVILRPNQIFFKWYGGFLKKSLFSFHHLFVQNNESQEILNNKGFKNSTVCGDTRFDRVYDTFLKIAPIEIFEKFILNKTTWVVGSAWPADMEVIIPFINNNPDLKFIIAPHEINSDEIEIWCSKINEKSEIFTGIDAKSDISGSQVLFVDTVGMLSSIYQYANYAYIGGSFGKGLHNTLEAAVFGPPIFFGNKSFLKFQEAKDLIQLGIAFPISDSKELQGIFSEFRNNIALLNKCKKKSNTFIQLNKGATEKILGYLIKKGE